MGFSAKQREIMRFPYTKYDALIADGAVRSGKTSIMSLSFFLWAMGNFNNCAFAFCGRSVGAVERNIVTPLLSVVYRSLHGAAQEKTAFTCSGARMRARIC